ncbi:MAG: pitrilysin family protein [Alphaproteobacteria bacterium]|nr:pitrilysin family protein [Alphaproteobacteria bacterium]
MSNVKVTTLANGLRVAVDSMPEVESASLGIWVACGTRHESAELNGMAHMLEHMAFKGTKTRSARAIAEEIENVGGSLNAYTGREITAYHASVLKEDVGLGIEMVADILRNSVFDPDELQRERGVILQEIGQALDTPDDLIFDQFQATALPEQPLGRPVLGTAESVEAIGRDHLFAYLARHYTASNMVLSAAGRVNEAEILDLADKHFGSVPRTHANADVPAPLRYVGGDGRETRVLEQAHLVLGCEGIGYRDPDYYAMAVYSTLFGGGMSSRLFQRIREERGLVYGIHCFNAAYADGGLFGIYAGTGQDDLGELVPAVCEEFAGIADTLGDAELVRARNQIKAGTLMALESSGARCEQAARHMLIHGRPIPYEETVARIEAVDAAAVRRVARRLLQGKLTIAALGPIDELEAIDKIAARLAA